MKKLWRQLPPPLADSFGFLEIIRQTDGFGLIDDCSGYRLTEERHSGADTRTCCSEVDSEDVVNGSKDKILEAFQRYYKSGKAAFALFASGPCAAMIGTDLNEIAQELSEKYELPVGVTKVTGQKNYDIGFSETMHALVKLLCEAQEVIPRAVNLIGGNRYDLPEGTLQKVQDLFEQREYSVIANPGGPVRAEEIRRMPSASLNIVLTVSGLDTARYLKEMYGTPYTTIFSSEETAEKTADISSRKITETSDPETDESEEETKRSSEENGILPETLKDKIARVLYSNIAMQIRQTDMDKNDHILIISEQFQANTIRRMLREETEDVTIQTATLYRFVKDYTEPGDVRLKSEEEVKSRIQNGGYQVIVGDPTLRVFASPDIKWIDLPHQAMHQYETGSKPEA